MYGITINLTNKTEKYYSKVGDRKTIPLGDILSSLLRIKTESEVESFMSKFDVHEKLCRVIIDSPEIGMIDYIPSDSTYNVIKSEQQLLLSVLKSYEQTRKNDVLRTEKYTDGVSHYEKDGNIYITKETLKLMRNSHNYSIKKNNVNLYSTDRLNRISIELDCHTVELEEKTKVTIVNEYEDPIKHSLDSKNFLSIEFTYRYKSNDFLSLPWLELIEIIKGGVIPSICETCSNYYFNAVRNKKKQFCYECGPKSQSKDRKTAIQYIRRNKYNDEQANEYLNNSGVGFDQGFKKYKSRKKRKKECE